MTEPNRKAILSLNRVRKHRNEKKTMNDYENSVRSEIVEKKRIQDDLLNENGSFSTDHDLVHIENEKSFDIKSELQSWAIKHRITHMAVNDLLKIMNNAGFMMPKDSRTFLKTPTHVEIKKLSAGKLWYNGLKERLTNIFNEVNRSLLITMDFNFDGAPLYNSSQICFWPILSSIRGIPTIIRPQSKCMHINYFYFDQFIFQLL